jgi:hypothetical protein
MGTGTKKGEYLVGAYLRVIERCNFVDYNFTLQEVGQ